jgi:hypothetical protein
MFLWNTGISEVRVEVMSDAGLGNSEQFAFGGENMVSECVVGVVVVAGDGGMKLRNFFREAMSVVDEFPTTGETLDAAECLEIHDVGL